MIGCGGMGVCGVIAQLASQWPGVGAGTGDLGTPPGSFQEEPKGGLKFRDLQGGWEKPD